MKETIINTVLENMKDILIPKQLDELSSVLVKELTKYDIVERGSDKDVRNKENAQLLDVFISSKKIEGCSDKTIAYYRASIEKLILAVEKNVCEITTNDIRCYLAEQQETRGLSKVTIDNLRRIYSSFSHGWKMKIT